MIPSVKPGDLFAFVDPNMDGALREVQIKSVTDLEITALVTTAGKSQLVKLTRSTPF